MAQLLLTGRQVLIVIHTWLIYLFYNYIITLLIFILFYSYNAHNVDVLQVVGWGVTENDEPSPILLEKVLQLFEIKNCLKKFSYSFYKYLTNDKFCVDDPSGNKCANLII